LTLADDIFLIYAISHKRHLFRSGIFNQGRWRGQEDGQAEVGGVQKGLTTQKKFIEAFKVNQHLQGKAFFLIKW